jgi:hypothetical protein
MMRSLVTTVFALLIALPASPDARQVPTEHSGLALRRMSDGEFTLFLRRLDTGVSRWKVQLTQMDIRSLSSDQEEVAELERSYDLCLQSLDVAREEIQSLSQRQTLKLDFLLLVDLNDLTRNLDELSRDLMEVSGGSVGVARKSLEYARGVLGTDAALAPYLVQFQRHILAFAGMMDAMLDQTDEGADPPVAQNEAATARGSGNYTRPIKEELR